MTNMRFPFRRLPDDLGLMVLKTMEYHEIIAYSLTSKKALSLVQFLGLSLQSAQIKIGWPSIFLDFGDSTIQIKWKEGEYDEEMMSFDDIPINVAVTTRKNSLTFDFVSMEFFPIFEIASFTWSNKGKSIGQWVQHIYSIFRCDWYEATFHIGMIRYDIQSLRTTFPKLNKTVISCFNNKPNEHNIQSAQVILRAFLPYVNDVQMFSVRLQENVSLQHIGMVNLRKLEMHDPPNLNFGDILIWNVEFSIVHTYQFSMRDMNRFFKMWTNSSFPRLRSFKIYGKTIVDWNVLLKGLHLENERRLETEGAERGMEFIIQNCYGTLAEIRVYNDIPTNVSVHFTVSNSR
ncbi:hypothetical protein B9Z55_011253 [Caenorhabditis nigoni]|uniref:Uncharacterized protein n=1 Tax=Caenorhabditis nigoni TaxID=1611254 RepID=A0A2G5UJA2_9PELO|nr:hypothetical protein B9Z55_011253 [Caenorhabditis nigoni]